MARVVVEVMPKPEFPDPQGQAVASAMPRLGVANVSSVRVGKRIEIEFRGEVDLDQVREIAQRLLANPVLEEFTIRVDEGGRTAGSAAGDMPGGGAMDLGGIGSASDPEHGSVISGAMAEASAS